MSVNIFSRIAAGWNGFWSGGSSDSDGYIPLGSDPDFDQSTQTEEKYLGISAYFACIRNICEDVGKLPFILYQRLERGKQRASDHKYYNLVRYRAAPAITSAALRETLCRFALGWGNGYAQIYRQNNGEVRLIQPVHPQYVTPIWDGTGDVKYIVKKNTEPPETVPSSEMIHIHGVGSNGVMGMSIAAYGIQSFTMAGAVRQFGTNLYTANGRPGGYLKTASKLSPEAKKANVEAWKQANAGGKMGGTAMLDNALEYNQITVNPTDAQYLETTQFTVEEVARWFRMPLHKIQYLLRAQGWSTLDAQNTDYLTDTLLPWLIRIEDEYTYKLLNGETGYFCEHLVDGILRGDAATRGEYYVKMFSIGALTINEIRGMENRNAMDGDAGDKHFVPLNMTPAEFADSVSGRGKTEKTPDTKGE